MMLMQERLEGFLTFNTGKTCWPNGQDGSPSNLTALSSWVRVPSGACGSFSSFFCISYGIPYGIPYGNSSATHTL